MNPNLNSMGFPIVDKIHHAPLVIEINFEGINTIICTFCYLNQLFKKFLVQRHRSYLLHAHTLYI